MYLKNLLLLLRKLDYKVIVSVPKRLLCERLSDFALANKVMLSARPNAAPLLDSLLIGVQAAWCRATRVIVSASVPSTGTVSLAFAIPSVHIYHSAAQSPLGNDMKWLIRRFLRAPHRLVAVSVHMRKAMLTYYGVKPRSRERVMVVPSGVEDLSGQFRRIPSTDQTVLTLGHVVHYKNVGVWVQTAEYVSSRLLPSERVTFLWAGDGPELEDWQRKVGIREDIRFVGFLDNPSELFARATVYYQPSLLESFGLAVVEAMSFGLPCVVSSCGGLPEIVENGTSGMVLDPQDYISHGEALLRIIRDKSLRERLSQQARRRYITRFSYAGWESAFKAVALVD